MQNYFRQILALTSLMTIGCVASGSSLAVEVYRYVDGNGQVLQKGPRRETGVLLAEVVPDGRSSPYHLIGDWPAWACVWLSGLALAVGVVGRFRKGE